MGTAPPSKPTSQPDAPRRPFDPTGSSGRSCLTSAFLLSSKGKEPSTLVQLILRQDWQRVLVRAKLYPWEISQTVSMVLYDIPFRLMPLHLVCALDPPDAVVAFFLELHPDAAEVPITAIQKASKHKKNRNKEERQNKKKSVLRSPLGLFRKYSRLTASSSRSHIGAMSLPGIVLPDDQRIPSSSPPQPPEQYPTSDLDEFDDMATPDENLLKQPLVFKRTKSLKRTSSTWRPQRRSRSFASRDSFRWGKQEAESKEEENDWSKPLAACNGSLSSSSSVGSAGSWEDPLTKQGIILQLSPSGDLMPFPAGSNDTGSTSETMSQTATLHSKTQFGIQWDLNPLGGGITQPTETFLPIHIACLYQASPSVLKLLLDAHPAGTCAAVLGMLPIHMVCAGWFLQPMVAPLPPPPDTSSMAEMDTSTVSSATLQPFHQHHPHRSAGSRLKEVLEVLCRSLPESARIRSGNHGMTPCEYLASSLEDGKHKQECMGLLDPGGGICPSNEDVEVLPSGPLDELRELSMPTTSLIFMDSYDGWSTIPDEIHCSSSCSTHRLAPSKTISLHTLLMAQDWEAALCLAEDDPQQAQEWFYGMEDLPPQPWGGAVPANNSAISIKCMKERSPNRTMAPTCQGKVWKRLALHLACIYRAPVGLVEVLLEAYPDAASKPEPHSGLLPLHFACQYRASFRVIKALLVCYSAATKAIDQNGRLPLHYAVLSKAHYAIIELMVTIDPEACLTVEPSRKQSVAALAKDLYGPRSPVVRLLEMVSSVFQKHDTPLLDVSPLVDPRTGLTSWESI